MREIWLVYKREAWRTCKRETRLDGDTTHFMRYMLRMTFKKQVVQGRLLVLSAFEIVLPSRCSCRPSLLVRASCSFVIFFFFCFFPFFLLLQLGGCRADHGSGVFFKSISSSLPLSPCLGVSSSFAKREETEFTGSLMAGNLFGWVDLSSNRICKQVGCSLLFSERTARPILSKWLNSNIVPSPPPPLWD